MSKDTNQYRKPKEFLDDRTDILFLGLPGYGISPHIKRNYWTLAIIAELRRSLGWKRKTRTHDLRPWKAHGVQIMPLDGVHTYNLLRYIVHERKEPMVVVLVGAPANKFKPCLIGAPDHILCIYTDFPGINVQERIGKFYGSDVFIKAAKHVGKDLDIWRIN